MDIRNYLTNIIEEAAVESIGDTEISLEHPANPDFGDFSTNVAMKMASGQNPRAVAEQLVEKIQTVLAEKADTTISKVEVAGPGFINFTLSEHFLLEELSRAATKSVQLVPKPNQGKKVVVEFTDPNPFKQFHIGHMYVNIIGESICRLFEATGARVRRANYFGDVGMHAAKSIWGAAEKIHYELEKTIPKALENLSEKPLEERVKFLGEAYALGSNAYKDSETAKIQIERLNKLLYVVSQELMVEELNWKPIADYKQFLDRDILEEYDHDEIKQLFKLGKEWSLAEFETVYDRVGMHFDNYYPESHVAEFGMQLVYEGLEKGIFTKSEGAIIYEGKKHGLHNRVFINSSGLPTYEAKELGLAPAKAEDGEYDFSLIIIGSEIDEYFKVLIQAMKDIRPEFGNKTKHLPHGMVGLPGDSMSSRKGNIITAKWLLDEAKDQILQVLKTSKTGSVDQSGDLVQGIAEQVGQAAIKYAFLKSNIGKDIAFSFDESLSFQGNSGPYLQYTYVRCLAVLKKAAEAGFNVAESTIVKHIDTLINNKEHFDNLLNKEEIDIVRNIYSYSEVVSMAVAEYAPHHLCTYLFNLAQSFNLFYAKHQIVGAQTEDTRIVRLGLTLAVKRLLSEGLGLLNIAVVEKM